MEEKIRRKQRTKLADYQPYPVQKTFHDAGAEHRERLFMASNQTGKTLAGGFEVAMHLTGLYPDWWEGRRFDGATRGWAAGVTSESTRDNPQRILVGPPASTELWGSGTIPGDLIEGQPSRARNMPDAIDSLVVRHTSGAVSMLNFKSYEKGREKWQGETLHFVWYDEEPPLEIYTEGLTRTNATGGLVFLTFTPLLGMSEVVRMFLSDNEVKQLA